MRRRSWATTVTLVLLLTLLASGTCSADNGDALDIPWWARILQGALPVILIFVGWYLYEWSKKRKLTPEQRKKLRALQPKKLDALDQMMLILFAVVLVGATLIFALGWTYLIFVVGTLGLIVGLLAMFAFVKGASTVSTHRKLVEMSDSELTEAQVETYTWEERVKSIKQIIIGMLVLLVVLSAVSVVMAYWLFGGSAIAMLSGLLYFIPIFVVLIIFYYYFSRRKD